MRLRVAAAALAICLGAGPGAQAGVAAFPGKNGKIVFSGERGGADGLFTRNLDGSGERRIYSDLYFDAHWSADGRQIVFAGDLTRIYVVSPTGQALRRLSAEADVQQASLSPGGKRVAYSRGPTERSTSGCACHVYVTGAEGGPARQLTVRGGYDEDPVWSPNGRSIAFSRMGGAADGLYLVAPDGSGMRPVTRPTGGEDDVEPDWSPDGKRLVFARCGDPCRLYVVNADGTGLRPLGRKGQYAAWSPDGRQIVFVDEIDDNLELYVMKANGTDAVRLTNTPEDEFDPDWQPLP